MGCQYLEVTFQIAGRTNWGCFLGSVPCWICFLEVPLGAVLGPSRELRWSLDSGTCGATGPGVQPPPPPGSFTPQDKAKAGVTWIFNFYLPIFCRKNILGVLWKEAHEFLSHYFGVCTILHLWRWCFCLLQFRTSVRTVFQLKSS